MHNLWNAISPCMTPGVDGCVVWWDAWAVFIAGIATIATVFLGLMTLMLGRQTVRLGRVSIRLGRAANRAAAAATRIARQEADARAKVEEQERLMVLLQIRAEIYAAVSKFQRAHVITHSDTAGFLAEESIRRNVIRMISSCTFPTAKSLSGRLHYIGHPEAGKLALVMGMAERIQDTYGNFDAVSSISPPQELLAHFQLSSTLLVQHISPVNDACHKAAIDAGVEKGC